VETPGWAAQGFNERELWFDAERWVGSIVVGHVYFG